MAVPPGSSMQALRVGSGRGPTLRTALRGATSERVVHATGPTCSGRVITRFIDDRSERAPQSSPLPSRPNCRRLTVASWGGCHEATPPRYGRLQIAQVPDFIRFTPFRSGDNVETEVTWNKGLRRARHMVWKCGSGRVGISGEEERRGSGGGGRGDSPGSSNQQPATNQLSNPTSM